MRFATMLKDVLRSFGQQPVTEKYPFVKTPAPDRLRGRLVWNPEKCSGCCLCSKDCPSDAIELITLDKKAKRFVMRYHADRCTFCAQCVQNCRFECLGMSDTDWELAALAKQPFDVYYGKEDDINAVLAKLAAAKTGELPPP
jgi:formate hydrogenlyase subunit 6/NADH:ubiquinone oxidoreductase subunit I